MNTTKLPKKPCAYFTRHILYCVYCAIPLTGHIKNLHSSVSRQQHNAQMNRLILAVCHRGLLVALASCLAQGSTENRSLVFFLLTNLYSIAIGIHMEYQGSTYQNISTYPKITLMKSTNRVTCPRPSGNGIYRALIIGSYYMGNTIYWTGYSICHCQIAQGK